MNYFRKLLRKCELQQNLKKRESFWHAMAKLATDFAEKSLDLELDCFFLGLTWSL